jgi:hypothetical protein
MTDLRHAGLPVPKFRTPRPECRWEKATDGALVMVWSLAQAAPPAVRVVGGNPNARRPAPVNDLAQPAWPIRRVRSLGERFAIALLLGVGGYLTLTASPPITRTFRRSSRRVPGQEQDRASPLPARSRNLALGPERTGSCACIGFPSR